MLNKSSMVATDMAKTGSDFFESQGIDVAALAALAALAASVEQSCQDMLRVVSNVTLSYEERR